MAAITKHSIPLEDASQGIDSLNKREIPRQQHQRGENKRPTLQA